ncbi:MAG: hypothetical protein WCP60_04085 [bacterium]
MTTQEAKLILQAYRTGSADEADPFFTEALELARIDTDLGAWFERQSAFDQKMVGALESEIPPAGLRDAILARKTSPLALKQSKPYRPLSMLVSLTAAIVLFVGIVSFHHGSGRMTVAAFSREALDIKEQGKIALEKMSSDPQSLRKWLADRGAPSDFVLPQGLKGVSSFGCQSFDIGGNKVSLICFDLGNNQVAHLFVVDKSALADASQSSLPQMHVDKGLAFATWTSGNKCFVLTGDNVSKEKLQKLI